MRAFIAIELSEEIKTSLSRLQDELKTSGADVKWVRPENIHLTLKFLGEIDKSQLEKVKAILNAVASQGSAFSLSIGSLGVFPKINFPRVVWVGVNDGDAQVKALAHALEEEMQTLGIPKEDRPFSSHITIGRVRSPKNKERLLTILQELTNSFGGKSLECRISKITLLESTLSPQGPLYEALQEANLTIS